MCEKPKYEWFPPSIIIIYYLFFYYYSYRRDKASKMKFRNLDSRVQMTDEHVWNYKRNFHFFKNILFLFVYSSRTCYRILSLWIKRTRVYNTHRERDHHRGRTHIVMTIILRRVRVIYTKDVPIRRTRVFEIQFFFFSRQYSDVVVCKKKKKRRSKIEYSIALKKKKNTEE